jgi:hypothetical protein
MLDLSEFAARELRKSFSLSVKPGHRVRMAPRILQDLLQNCSHFVIVQAIAGHEFLSALEIVQLFDKLPNCPQLQLADFFARYSLLDREARCSHKVSFVQDTNLVRCALHWLPDYQWLPSVSNGQDRDTKAQLRPTVVR